MPCCFDALSARLIEQAGFELTFMSGFAVSASRLGMPDTGLISFGEMLDQGRNICSATRLPVIGDGDMGADILFFEAPQSESEMITLCEAIPGPKMANLVEGGDTPLLPPERIEEIGYKIAAYPLTLLSAAAAMLEALRALGNGGQPANSVDFDRLRDILGFDDYDAEAERYRPNR